MWEQYSYKLHRKLINAIKMRLKPRALTDSGSYVLCPTPRQRFPQEFVHCSPFWLGTHTDPKPTITQVIKLNNCIWTLFKGVIQGGALPRNQFTRCYQTLPPLLPRGMDQPRTLLGKWTSSWPLGGARRLQKGGGGRSRDLLKCPFSEQPSCPHQRA